MSKSCNFPVAKVPLPENIHNYILDNKDLMSLSKLADEISLRFAYIIDERHIRDYLAYRGITRKKSPTGRTPKKAVPKESIYKCNPYMEIDVMIVKRNHSFPEPMPKKSREE